MGSRESRRPTRHRNRIRSEALAPGSRSATGEGRRTGSGGTGKNAATPVSTAHVSELSASAESEHEEQVMTRTIAFLLSDRARCGGPRNDIGGSADWIVVELLGVV